MSELSELTDAPPRARGDRTVETLRTVQRYAETLILDARRVLTRCVSGQLDPEGVAEDLHANGSNGRIDSRGNRPSGGRLVPVASTYTERPCRRSPQPSARPA